MRPLRSVTLDRAVASPIGHLVSAALVCVAASTPASSTAAWTRHAPHDPLTLPLALSFALAFALGAAHYLALTAPSTSRAGTLPRVAVAWCVGALPTWAACDAVGLSSANDAVVLLGCVSAYCIELFCAQVRFALDAPRDPTQRWLSVHANCLFAATVIGLALALVSAPAWTVDAILPRLPWVSALVCAATALGAARIHSDPLPSLRPEASEDL